MARVLTVDDVLNDQIDDRAFDAPEVTSGGKGILNPVSGKKVYRTPTGNYVGHFAKTWLKIVEQGANEGRKFLSIHVKLYDESDKFQGSTFAKVSWIRVQREDGKDDMQFRLFQQIINILQAPRGTPVSEVLEALDGEYVGVWGKEYYAVKYKDLLEAHKAGALRTEPEDETFVFLDAGQDEIALHYIAAGYDPKFMVMQFEKLEGA